MKCILHIGTSKTATTLLQKWLYENELALSSQGVALTQTTNVPNNRKLVSYFQNVIDDYLLSRSVTNFSERERFFTSFDTKLAAELHHKAQDHHTVIFTSEHFYSRLPELRQIQSLKSFLDQFFSDYQIVCYFREQGAVRTSLYSTALKSGAAVELSQFQKDITTENAFYNYYSSFGRWEDVFGKDRLSPRLFDKKCLDKGDIRKDFLSTALPEVDASVLSFPSKAANISLSQPAARMYRKINELRPRYIGRQPDPVPPLFKRVAADSKQYYVDEAINDPRQIELYNTFDGANVAFFQRYFGREENLFRKPPETAELTPEPSISEHALTEAFSRLLGRKDLTLINAQESKTLRDLALRLFDNGTIEKHEALVVLNVASRVRPNDEKLFSQIEEIINTPNTTHKKKRLTQKLKRKFRAVRQSKKLRMLFSRIEDIGSDL